MSDVLTVAINLVRAVQLIAAAVRGYINFIEFKQNN